VATLITRNEEKYALLNYTEISKTWGKMQFTAPEIYFFTLC